MADSTPRMTMSTQAVLRTLVDDPTKVRYGLEISAATGLPSGTIHPILARLESLGWVESDWEEVDPKIAGRPRRRYYRLSEHGLSTARNSLAQAHAARTKIVKRFRPIGETT